MPTSARRRSADNILGEAWGRRRRTPKLTEEIRYALGKTRLGRVLVALSAKGVVAILQGRDRALLEADLRRRFPRARLVKTEVEVASHLQQIAAFVENPARALELPLDIRGTAFQQRVWAAVRAILPGQTSSYAEIARQIGLPKASRAVGSACAANPLALATPCHRVLRKDGSAAAGMFWRDGRLQTMLRREARATA